MPGMQELIVIAVVALFVLGPDRLPEVARAASRLLMRVRNYGVTATKELRGFADLSSVEREVSELRRELDRTRDDLRRAMRETIVASDPQRTTPDRSGAVQPEADAASPDAASSDAAQSPAEPDAQPPTQAPGGTGRPDVAGGADRQG